jgi:sugar lactone lactonase YvrE
MKPFRNFTRCLPTFLGCFLLLACISSPALSEETYVFERMWPTIQQPWYFTGLRGIAIDKRGYIYAVDEYYHSVMKFNPDGQLVAKWGGVAAKWEEEGLEDGKFLYPEGIAIDIDGFVYVGDTGNTRIQKLTSEGHFVMSWETDAQNGSYEVLNGLAVDNKGFVYASDSGNDRILKFTSEGQFVDSWGSEGTGDGEFNNPSGIVVDIDGFVYVVDSSNNRIQKFTADGQFVNSWGGMTGAEGIGLDKNGFIYVSESYRILKFTRDGQLLDSFGNYGPEDGQLRGTQGIAFDNFNYIYIVDPHGIQKFTHDGQFMVKWGSGGTGNGQFNEPHGITIDNNGYVYIVDSYNNRIQKFTSGGQFVSEWGGKGFEDGKFDTPYAITIDSSGTIYVTDLYNWRIQKFDQNGQFLGKWGSIGSEDGQFNLPTGIAVDNSYVYVTDEANNCVQKFTLDGQFITKWGTSGPGDGEFNHPQGITVDNNGYVYVVDWFNGRIQKFTSNGEFTSKWSIQIYPRGIVFDNNSSIYVSCRGDIKKFTLNGELIMSFGDYGSNPGQISEPTDLQIHPNGNIYIVDTYNNRIQVFKKVTIENQSKAIVLAGGGSYPGNNLWDATQLSANFAYRTLTYQGFTKNSIYYLTSDTDLDLDSNGELDDVDGDATNANLEHAITSWASDAEDVVLYLVNHGGDGTFRMSGTETLSALDLDSWLDQLQGVIPGKVTVIYDACESGSFISELTPPSGKDRVVISSTSPGESAYFVTQGSVSFSNFFWTHIFNGLDINEAFDLATQSIGQATDYQHPLLDTNGNGTANEAGDFTLVENSYIGNGTEIFGDAPVITSVSDNINISGTSSATLTATGVTDDDGIARVWAIIRPPDYYQGAADNPVQNLPSIDLMPVGDNDYEKTYDGFNIDGTYNIAIYARDRIGNTSIPKLTTVSVNNPLKRKAIIVAGGPETNDLWNAVENNATLVYEALAFQGYTDDDIYFMSPVTFLTGIDGTPNLSNLDYAITTWAQESTQDLVLYMIGNGEYGTFELNESEILSSSQLDSWLDNLQANISGKVTVIYDASFSGSFLPSLVPPDGKERILISSSSSSQSSYFISDGDISFSKFFWSHILNGMNVRDAFINAKNAMYYCAGQSPQMDDNSNGIGNEKLDGLLSREYSIGVGIMLAGDDPVVGSISPGQTLYDGSTSATIWAEDVTTTGAIDKVWAVITSPGALNDPVSDIPTVELVDDGSGHYEGTYNDFSTYGSYDIAVYAMDMDGNVSLPKETYVYQEIGPDLYEDDDNFNDAGVLIMDYEEAQRHNFHDQGDQDWVKFYGISGESYEIKTVDLEENCDTVIMLYDETEDPVLEAPFDDGLKGEDELLSWQCTSDGVYYLVVEQFDPGDYGLDTGYDLNIYHPVGGLPGWLTGVVVNSLGEGIGDAVIKSDVSNSTAMSNDNGAYIMVLPSGTHVIRVEISGYEPRSWSGVEVLADNYTSQDFVMSTGGKDIELNTGWNLVSLSEHPTDTSISNVLNTIADKYISVWAYIDGSWKVYDPENPGFSDLTTIEAGKGYWINMSSTATLAVSGLAPSSSMVLSTGWNLVGYNSDTSQSVADVLASIEDKYISVWAYMDGGWKVYDPENPGFSDLTTMEPGYGYWINASEACTWILP